MVVMDSSTASLLSCLHDALTAASSAFPSEEESLLPPIDGISLLDVKNEVLLSYLHNVVFLILLRLRHREESDAESQRLGAETVKKLVELRVYLEKGVRPLEGRLKYQIDKVLRAAEDADRVVAQRKSDQKSKRKGVIGDSVGRESSEELNGDPDSDASPVASEMKIDDLSYRPNPAALLRKADNNTALNTKSRSTSTNAAYKPPRITPTSMPLPPSSRNHTQDRKRKSHLLDEYIDTELSSAPQSQPSIGSNSTILDRGRGSLSARDRVKEKERTEYEERNLIRLPGESKAEKRKARLRGDGGGRRDMFGGEDWSGLGGLGDRVVRSVSGKSKGDRAGVLERREKRRRPTEDGPRGDGVGMGIGETFEKRRKVLAGRSEKKGRRGGR